MSFSLTVFFSLKGYMSRLRLITLIATSLYTANTLALEPSEFLTFTVDPTRSSFTYSGDVNGLFPLTEQAPGSFDVTVAGTISGALFQIAPLWTRLITHSDVQGVPKAGPFAPSDAPAVMAGQVDLGGVTAFGLFRNVSIHLSLVVDLLGTNNFSVLGARVDVTGDFDAFTPTFTLPFSENGRNMSNELGSLTWAGRNRVLTIPVDVSFRPYPTLNSRLTGHVVAIAVPEANTLCLMASACAAAMGGFAYRKRRC